MNYNEVILYVKLKIGNIHFIKSSLLCRKIMQNIIQICEHSSFLSYYKELHDDNYVNDIKKRQGNIKKSTNSMTKYYATMNFVNKNDIYTSYLCDPYRYTIT